MIAAAAPVELRQGAAAFERFNKAPATGGRIRLHHQQIDAAGELAQAVNQPGPMGPGAAAAHDQHVAAGAGSSGR